MQNGRGTARGAAVDERRLTVWRALSELFLDTELDASAYARIAQVVAASGYSPDELKTILWNELFPVLQYNLRSVAGEWSGWSDEWLVQHIRVSEKKAVIPRLNGVVGVIREKWGRVVGGRLLKTSD